jgi:hypothetical protein
MRERIGRPKPIQPPIDGPIHAITNQIIPTGQVGKYGLDDNFRIKSRTASSMISDTLIQCISCTITTARTVHQKITERTELEKHMTFDDRIST